MTIISQQSIIHGEASGELLVSDMGLSFWGGVDPVNGLIIDQHHPLRNQNVNGKVLALPSGRGSSTGSGVMLELLLNKVAPAALIFTESEDIITLGVLVSTLMFDRSIPVCRVSATDFKLLESGTMAHISEGGIGIDNNPSPVGNVKGVTSHTVKLTETDRQLLDGEHGKAAQLAMEIVVRMAEIQGASELLDIEQGHIDACVYNGPSSLLFAQKLQALGGKVKVPTTLNSLSVDKRCWKKQGVHEEFGVPASKLGDAYVAIGAQPTYTCAPYLLDSAPVFGQQIVWAESNAVSYANSVIGARTQKYPDFLDACIALTARAPAAGAHTDAGRTPTLNIDVVDISKETIDDAFWPLLGYHVGAVSQNQIPIVCGLENFAPTPDNHKAFSAAFATTSSVPMYHINKITPEAENAISSMASSVKSITIDIPSLVNSWNELNSASDSNVDVICLGNPHFSASECAELAALCKGRRKHSSVTMIVTLGRDVHSLASEAGDIQALEAFGVRFINDTCWCMIEEPIIPIKAKVLMTNSGKYAHYGPGLVNRPMYFGSLADCVEVACKGQRKDALPNWLIEPN